MALFEIKPKPKKQDYKPEFIKSGQFNEEELPIAELIQRRRLQILVHSCLYYDMDTNLITDKQFDEWGLELLQLQKNNPEICKRVCFANDFKDWDASTGAFLPLKNKWVIRKAKQLLTTNKNKSIKENER